MIKNCLICKKEFRVKPYLIKMGYGKYCSHKCYSEAAKQGKYPKRGFQKGHPQFNTGRTHFKKGIIPIACFKKGNVPWNKGKEFMKGENHPNWKGGISPLAERIRKTEKYKQWVSKIYERDYWTCQICKKKQRDNLIAHHKPPNTFSNLLEKYRITTLSEALKCKELWNIGYGITWCRKCHAKFHYHDKFKG